MLYTEYCKSLKTPNYDKNLIDKKKKMCIDEMLEKNISTDIIISSLNITKEEFDLYFNNEWCYIEPDRYFYITWVNWVNSFVKQDKQKTL